MRVMLTFVLICTVYTEQFCIIIVVQGQPKWTWSGFAESQSGSPWTTLGHQFALQIGKNLLYLQNACTRAEMIEWIHVCHVAHEERSLGVEVWLVLWEVGGISDCDWCCWRLSARMIMSGWCGQWLGDWRLEGSDWWLSEYVMWLIRIGVTWMCPPWWSLVSLQ